MKPEYRPFVATLIVVVVILVAVGSLVYAFSRPVQTYEVCGPVNEVYHNGQGQWFATVNGTSYAIYTSYSYEIGKLAGDLMYLKDQGTPACVTINPSIYRGAIIAVRAA